MSVRILLILITLSVQARSMVPQYPFNYNLDVRIKKRKTAHELTLCCHGYGHNSSIADTIHAHKIFKGYVVGFNFPDYNISSRGDRLDTVYGTPQEIMPLLFLLKFYACDLKFPTINLYGFSAGGGAIINALAFLYHESRHELIQSVGIGLSEKNTIIRALSRGLIILDCPLKSVEEIITLRGSTPELELIHARATQNNMNPIEAICFLQGMNLSVIVHFQNPDEIVHNRDDKKFIERVRCMNKGTTVPILGYDGGHNKWHKSLWKYVKHLLSNKK